MNRKERVLDYLKNKSKYIHTEFHMRRYGMVPGITVKECEEILGTTELRKIISDLIATGHMFWKVWEEGENRFGDKTRFKRYIPMTRTVLNKRQFFKGKRTKEEE